MILVEGAISIVILVGAFFLFVGSLGLAKLPDLMRRLHGPTKATTLGIGSMLIASMLYFWIVEGKPSIHEFLITLFLFLTAPVTAQMIAKAYILRERRAREALPDTGRPVGWATLDAAEPDERPKAERTFPTS
ncbi:Na+/H+ antiporter subunit G [Microvirga sp. KLBC 81]|uniref:Na+/H+ antiporter subunit G n=1 Tax=Microvirga sp. KLBC 81 TaxID=1862707 RepID=UPI000D5188E8|nr:Na+/H+ antiporter subunit G [Microvirga sp. KLBC 81]PVE25455.1 Na+/H+ antiporter subunit G [Microvirga sp. KLBC 81]